jgi:hypothetical protein
MRFKMTDSEYTIDVIVLEGEDGQSYECELLDRFTFEGNEYVLLLKLNECSDEECDEDSPEHEEVEEDDDGEDESLVIMRVFDRDEQTVFQTIDSEEEFDRVRAHVEELVEAERQALAQD